MKRGVTCRGVCLMLVLWMCAALTGCGQRAAARRYFAYLDAPVQLALEGELDGMAFTALLSSQGRSATSGEGALSETASFTLTYLTPAALAGVAVRFDAQRPSEIALALDGLTAVGEVYEGLAGVGLLLMSESAVQSSRREQWRVGTARDACPVTVLETADGARRVHDAKTGLPLYASLTRDGHALWVNCRGE